MAYLQTQWSGGGDRRTGAVGVLGAHAHLKLARELAWCGRLVRSLSALSLILAKLPAFARVLDVAVVVLIFSALS